MVAYVMAHQKDDEPAPYYEVVSSRPLADVFKDKGGWLRGSFSLNGRMYNNFESNSPENFMALVNAKSSETGVRAELTEDGHVKLSQPSAQPILIAQGPAYYPPQAVGQPLPTDLPPNTILEDLGFEETTEQNAAFAAQMSRGNGLVGQVGDGRVVTGAGPTLDEINKRSLEDQAKGTGGRAPHAPHETVPGTTTTGDTPQRVAPASNAERVSQTDVEQATPPGGGRPTATLAAGRVGEQAPTDTMNDEELTDEQADALPEYADRTVADLRDYAREHDVNLQGATTKADIIRAIKKHDRKVERDKAKK